MKHSKKQLLNEIERMLEEDGTLRFVDRDLSPIDYEDDEEYGDEEPYPHHLNLDIHNTIHLPKEEAKPINWEERFYEIAKEEYLRQNHVMNSDLVRAERAITSATVFIEAIKSVQSREKSK